MDTNCLEQLEAAHLVSPEGLTALKLFFSRLTLPKAETILLEIREQCQTPDASLFYSRKFQDFSILQGYFDSTFGKDILSKLNASPLQGIWLEFDVLGVGFSNPSPWFLMNSGKGKTELADYWPHLGAYLGQEPQSLSEHLMENGIPSPILGVLLGRTPATFRREIWVSPGQALDFLQRGRHQIGTGIFSKPGTNLIQGLLAHGYSGPLTLQVESIQGHIVLVGINLIRPLEHLGAQELLALLQETLGNKRNLDWLSKLLGEGKDWIELSHIKVSGEAQVKAYLLMGQSM